MTEAKKRKTDWERLEALKQQEAALKQRRVLIEEKLKDNERKRDARRKIIVGGAVMAHAKLDPAFAAALKKALNAAVTRDSDRELIADLLTGTGTAQPAFPALHFNQKTEG